MPAIVSANTQQVIQMGTHVEKVQQTIQQQQSLLVRQLALEVIENDDIKRNQVQETEDTYAPLSSDPDKEGKKGRLRTKAGNSVTTELNEENLEDPPLVIVEQNYGGQINLWA